MTKLIMEEIMFIQINLNNSINFSYHSTLQICDEIFNDLIIEYINSN